MLSPFSPIHWPSSALTLLVEYALTAPNEIYSDFTQPWWIFIVLGSLERSGPSESILGALSSIDTSGPHPGPLRITPPCLGTAQQLNFTFLFGFLPKFNRFSQFKLRCKAQIQALHLMSITHAPCQKGNPLARSATKRSKLVMNKKNRVHSGPWFPCSSCRRSMNSYPIAKNFIPPERWGEDLSNGVLIVAMRLCLTKLRKFVHWSMHCDTARVHSGPWFPCSSCRCSMNSYPIAKNFIPPERWGKDLSKGVLIVAMRLYLTKLRKFVHWSMHCDTARVHSGPWFPCSSCRRSMNSYPITKNFIPPERWGEDLSNGVLIVAMRLCLTKLRKFVHWSMHCDTVRELFAS